MKVHFNAYLICSKTILKSVFMSQKHQTSQIESLQTQMDEQVNNYQDSLRKDLPFRVLKDIRKKITDLLAAIERLKKRKIF